MAQAVLDWVMLGDVKLQDRVFIIVGVASAGPEGRNVAWNFFKVL